MDILIARDNSKMENSEGFKSYGVGLLSVNQSSILWFCFQNCNTLDDALKVANDMNEHGSRKIFFSDSPVQPNQNIPPCNFQRID